MCAGMHDYCPAPELLREMKETRSEIADLRVALATLTERSEHLLRTDSELKDAAKKSGGTAGGFWGGLIGGAIAVAVKLLSGG